MASTTVGITNLFLYCYFGQLATESYEQMADCSFELNWREFLMSLRKYLVIMIGNMSTPVYYQGFSVINLDLQTFTKVRLKNERLTVCVLKFLFIFFSY